MKTEATILSGKFTTGDTAKGNFTAYNEAGDRIFIHKSQMESLGWKADKDVVFPFYAIMDEKDINTRDDNGELTDVLVKRLQALSVFKTQDALVEASVSGAKISSAITLQKRLLELDSMVQFKAKADSAGLTETMVNALVSASI